MLELPFSDHIIDVFTDLEGFAPPAMSVLAAAGGVVRPEPPPHRRLYEFAKTALINIFAFPYAAVADLYCAGASDIDKFEDALIGHYIGIEPGISEDCEDPETPPWKPYTTEFCSADPSMDDLEAELEGKGVPVDVVSCFQHLQVCFESEERARCLLRNVSDLLRPGGYFVGITTDSSTLWTKYQKSVEASHSKGVKPCIRSENYIITFEVEEEKFPFFGKKYQIKFSNDLTSETHCLVHFASLIRLAREAGLDYVEIQNLTEFYDDNRAQLAEMLSNFGANFVDARGKLVARSFDVLGLYSMFVFQKPDPDATAPILSPMSSEGNEEVILDSSELIISYDTGSGLFPSQLCISWQHDGFHGSSRVQNEMDEEGQIDTAQGIGAVYSDSEKGILGPGPAELRFAEAPF